MKKKSVGIIGALALALAVINFSVQPAQAVNTTITAIYGTGNSDANWTAVTSGNIQLALRAQPAYVGGLLANNGSGTYYTSPGFAPAPHGSQASWNWTFSVLNTGGLLSADYYLGVDTDPTAGFSAVVFSPVLYGDNSYGIVATANGAGVEGSYAALAAGNTIMQNSENITFFPQSAFGLNPALPGTYDFNLYAVGNGLGPNSIHLADVNMRVVVGSSSVPDVGSTLGMLGASLVGLIFVRRVKPTVKA
jgi:hypothetical protein